MTSREQEWYNTYFEIETLLRWAPVIKRLPGYRSKFEPYAAAVVATERVVDRVTSAQPAHFIAAIAKVNEVLREEIDPWLLAELCPRSPQTYLRYHSLRSRVRHVWAVDLKLESLRSRETLVEDDLSRDWVSNCNVFGDN